MNATHEYHLAAIEMAMSGDNYSSRLRTEAAARLSYAAFLKSEGNVAEAASQGRKALVLDERADRADGAN